MLNVGKIKSENVFCSVLVLVTLVVAVVNTCSDRYNSCSSNCEVCIEVQNNKDNVNFTDGTRVVMECVWPRESHSFVEWKFANVAIRQATSTYFLVNSMRDELGISRISFDAKPGITGRYECFVSVQGTVASLKVTSVNIYYFYPVSILEPLNQQSSSNTDVTTVMKGNSLTLNCTPQNYDIRSWTDLYLDLIPDSEDGRVSILQEGQSYKLHIDSVTHKDSKEYYCFAWRYWPLVYISDNVIDSEYLLRPVKVKGKPEIYCDSQLRSVASQIRDVSLSCQVLADPPPDISWSGGEDGRTSLTILSEPNGLFNVIKGVTNTWSSTLYFSGHIMKSDSGVYTIVATNDYGTTMESIRLNVSNSSGPPLHPKVELVTSTSVNVSWVPPVNVEGLEITYFQVVYVCEKQPVHLMNTSQLPANQTSIILDLLPACRYSFEIQAFSAAGRSGDTDTLYITTGNALPRAPSSVTISLSTITPVSAEVKWDPLVGIFTGGHAILEYIISIHPTEIGNGVFESLTVPPDVNKVTLKGLSPETTFIAAVLGRSVLGSGLKRESEEFTTKILKSPGAPVDLRTAVVSSNSVQLCWIEDPDTYLVSAYHIFIYSERSSANRTIQERYMLDDHTCVKVLELQSEICYTFAVMVTNDVGSSELSKNSSKGCTSSPIIEGVVLSDKPEFLAPIIIIAVLVPLMVVLVLLCVAWHCCCRGQQNSYKTADEYNRQVSSESAANGEAVCLNTGNGVTVALLTSPKHLSENKSPPTQSQPAISAPEEWKPTGSSNLPPITADSGIPRLSVSQDYGEGEPVQWINGPAHDSNSTSQIAEWVKSVEQADSGYEYSENVSQMESQSSVNDVSMGFKYTENIGYQTVQEKSTIPDIRPSKSGVTLLTDPSNREREMVILPPRR